MKLDVGVLTKSCLVSVSFVKIGSVAVRIYLAVSTVLTDMGNFVTRISAQHHRVVMRFVKMGALKVIPDCKA
jgi:hypothetical protein